MKNRIYENWSPVYDDLVFKIKNVLSIDYLDDILNQISNINTLVLGEPIVDTYVYCEKAGVSSKSPTVAVRYKSSQDFAGGSLAIANHLAALNVSTTLICVHGGEEYFNNLLSQKLNKQIRFVGHSFAGIPTPRKTRFMAEYRHHRIFELIEIQTKIWQKHNPKNLCLDIQSQAREHQMTIVADFGHGLFEGDVLRTTDEIEGFVALNAQTNSENFGFNPYWRHKHFDYLCIDEQEFRLATHDRFSSIQTLVESTVLAQIQKPVSVTLGTQGSLLIDSKGNKSECLPFVKRFVDSTGAGDAYLTLSSLLIKLGVEFDVVTFLSNVYAGLKTSIQGNSASVSREALREATVEILTL